MSTNKTPNYQLHSWLPADEFHVSEINENFTKLDASLKAEAQTAAAGHAALLEQLNGKGTLILGSWSGGCSAQPVIDLGKPIKALLLENSNSWRGSLTDTRLHGGLILAGQTYRGGMVTINGSRFQINSIDNMFSSWTFYYLAWVES